MLERGAAALPGHGPSGGPEPQPQAIDRQIVKRTDQEKHPGEQQEFVL